MSFLTIGSSKRRPIRRLIAIERVLRVGHRLALGRLADQALAVLGEGDHRGRGARALGVLDDPGILAFHDGDAGIRRAEVDADDSSHSCLFLSRPAGSRSLAIKRCRMTPTGNGQRTLACPAIYEGRLGRTRSGAARVPARLRHKIAVNYERRQRLVLCSTKWPSIRFFDPRPVSAQAPLKLRCLPARRGPTQARPSKHRPSLPAAGGHA